MKRFTRRDGSTSVSKRWACVLSEWDFCSSGKDIQPSSTPLNAAPEEHFLGRGRRLLRSGGSQEYSDQVHAGGAKRHLLNVGVKQEAKQKTLPQEIWDPIPDSPQATLRTLPYRRQRY